MDVKLVFQTLVIVLANILSSNSISASAVESNKIDSFHPGLCGPNDGLILCANKIEKQFIKNNSHKTKRDKSDLILKTNKENIHFKDTKSINYAVIDLIHDYFIVVGIYEHGWHSVLISNETGTKTKLAGLPLFNNSGSKVIASSLDLDMGLNPNVIQIWRNVGNELSIIYEMSNFPEDGGPIRTEWINDSEAEISVLTLSNMMKNINTPAYKIYIKEITDN